MVTLVTFGFSSEFNEETVTCDSKGSRGRYMSVHIRYFTTLNAAFVFLIVTVAVVTSDDSLLSVIFYRYFRTVVS